MNSFFDFERHELSARVDVEAAQDATFVDITRLFLDAVPRSRGVYDTWRSVPDHPEGLVTRRHLMDERRVRIFQYDWEELQAAEATARDAIETRQARDWNIVELSGIRSLCDIDVNCSFYESQWVGRSAVEADEASAWLALVQGSAPSHSSAADAERSRHMCEADARRDLVQREDSDRISVQIDQVSAWLTLMDDAVASALRAIDIDIWRHTNLEANQRVDVEREEAAGAEGFPAQYRILSERAAEERELRTTEVVAEDMIAHPEEKDDAWDTHKMCQRDVDDNTSVATDDSDNDDDGGGGLSIDDFGNGETEIVDTERQRKASDEHEYDDVSRTSPPATVSMQARPHVPSYMQQEGEYDAWWGALDDIREEAAQQATTRM
eukprot:PhM_4_TR16470/c0_g1_i1/m.70610